MALNIDTWTWCNRIFIVQTLVSRSSLCKWLFIYTSLFARLPTTKIWGFYFVFAVLQTTRVIFSVILPN